MEYLNEYFGYDPNLFAMKQDVPLNLAAKHQKYHPYVPEKLQYNYKNEYFQEGNSLTTISIGSPSCTSDSESSISSSSRERFSASPIDILTVGNNNSDKTKEQFVPNAIELEYKRFREEHLMKLASRSFSNQNMRRVSQSDQHREDPTYREKREKNNLAAKKSRDARKQREDEMVVRCAFLESELMKSTLLRKQDKVYMDEESTKLRELDLLISQQSESINEFQKLIFQLKSNNNNNGNQASSLSI